MSAMVASPYEAVGMMHLRCIESKVDAAELVELRRKLAAAEDTIATLRELVAAYEDAPTTGAGGAGPDIPTGGWPASQRVLWALLVKAWPQHATIAEMTDAMGPAGRNGLDNRLKEMQARISGTGWRIERLRNAGARLLRDDAGDPTPETVLSPAHLAVWQALVARTSLAPVEITAISGAETIDPERRGQHIVVSMRRKLASCGCSIAWDAERRVYLPVQPEAGG